MRTVLREVRRKHENIAVVCGAWHVPALARKVAGQGRRRDSQGAEEGQGRLHLGAVDVRAAGVVVRLRRGRALARLVPPPVHHRRRGRAALAGRRGRRAAGRGRADVVRARHRGDPARRGAGRAARAAARRAGRGHRGGRGGDVRRRAAAGRADRPQAGRRRAAGWRCRTTCRPCRWLATSPRSSAACASSRRRWNGSSSWTCAATSTCGRSRLLHRLRAIGVPWGEPDAGRRGTGTFREEWRLRWQPEFAIRLVEGSMCGTTVAAAATAKVTDAARARPRRSPT